jgi:pilus assembly protein CpaF
MRPDRVIVGECRGAETLDMLQAMNTGHDGSMTTVHANSTRDALARIEVMVAMSGVELSPKALRAQITSAINIIVQARRLTGGKRKIVSVSEIIGMEGDLVTMHDLFTFEQRGVDENGDAIGFFRVHGIRPRVAERIEHRGMRLPPDLFARRDIESS